MRLIFRSSINSLLRIPPTLPLPHQSVSLSTMAEPTTTSTPTEILTALLPTAFDNAHKAGDLFFFQSSARIVPGEFPVRPALRATERGGWRALGRVPSLTYASPPLRWRDHALDTQSRPELASGWASMSLSWMNVVRANPSSRFARRSPSGRRRKPRLLSRPLRPPRGPRSSA